MENDIFKINQKMILVVFIIEFIICTGEGLMIINSHMNNQESWPWFFTFTINLPASALLATLTGYIFAAFEIKSFAIQSSLSYFILLIGGTLWWSTVLHIFNTTYKGIKNLIAKPRSEETLRANS